MMPAFAPAATTVSWNNAAGGTWNASNWTGGVGSNPPTSTDTAAFNLIATYNVSFTTNVSVAGVQFGGSNVTFTNVFDGITFNNTGTLNVTGGTFNLAAANPITWTNGNTISFNAPATVSAGNDMSALTLNVGSGNTVTTTATFTGSGTTLNVTSGVSVGNGTNSSGNLNLSSSASATTAGALTVGFSGVGNGTLNVNTGASLTHTGAITVGSTNFNSASMTVNNATVTASSGTLTVHSTGVLSIQNGGTFTLNNGAVDVRSDAGTQGKLIVGNGTGSPSSFTQTGAVGVTVGSLFTGNTATIQTNTGGSFTTGTGGLTVNKTGLVDIAGGTFALNSNATIEGTLQRSAGGTFNWASSKTMSVQNGGHLLLTNGYSLPTSASVTVTQASSTLTQSGLGALTISNGSQLTIATGATVTTAAEVISDGSAGTLNQTGGTHNLGGGPVPVIQLTLGNAGGGTGTYNLSGGDLTVTQDTAGVPAEVIGYGGTGNFVQTGGGHTVTGMNANLVLGYGASGVGNYTATNGYVTCGLLQIGSGHAGTMTLNNNGSALADTIEIARFNGVSGTLNANTGGSAVAFSSIYVGGRSSAAGGAGVVNINGGEVDAAGEIRIWDTTGTAVNLSSGTLMAGSLNTSGNPARFNWTGGTLRITGAGPFDSSAAATNISLTSGKSLIVTNTTNIPFSSSIACSGSGIFITGSLFGGGDLISDGNFISVGSDNTSTAFTGTITGAGGLSKVGSGMLSLRNTRIDNLSINGGTVRILPDSGSPSSTSRLNFLNIAAGCKLDLGEGKLIAQFEPVGTASGGVYTGLTGKIQSGRNGNSLPLWDGSTGIVSSQNAAITGNFHSIGIARASDVRPATATTTALWGGQTITGTDTLVMYTYGGDATLDGKINIDDYVRIDTGIAGGLTGWSNGDFNYDGKVSIDDYITVIDANIGNQNGVFPTASGGPASDFGGLSRAAGPVSAVPEPAASGILLALALPFLRRKRDRTRQRHIPQARWMTRPADEQAFDSI
jgi:hypothetical protein